jgi:hypothetical protein
LTPPKDYDRLAQNLYNRAGDSIIDKDSFEIALSEYIDEENAPVLENKNKIKVWESYSLKFDIEEGKQEIFDKRGGKSLKQDRLKTSKNVVKKPFQYKSSRKQDLIGLDTKTAKPSKIKTIKRVIFDARVKRYRDRYGRFTKVPKHYKRGNVRNVKPPLRRVSKKKK